MKAFAAVLVWLPAVLAQKGGKGGKGGGGKGDSELLNPPEVMAHSGTGKYAPAVSILKARAWMFTELTRGS
jgi:hypothetical protein